MNPIPMLLWCPVCGVQHVDRNVWSRIPHRSHLCHYCGVIWRPADIPTTGVRNIETRGTNDSWPVASKSEFNCVVCGRHTTVGRLCRGCHERWADLGLSLLADQRSYRSTLDSDNMSMEDINRELARGEVTQEDGE